MTGTTEAGGVRRARRLPPDQRREAIVAATLPLVRVHGDAVSTRQIAEAACIAEGTIFRAFADKGALMQAVTARALDPAPMLADLATIDPALPLRQRLVAAVGIIQDHLTGVFNVLDARLRTGTPPDRLPPKGSPAHEVLHAAMVGVVGSDADQLRVAPQDLARLMRLFVFATSHPRIAEGTPLSPQQIVDLLLDGVAARPGHRPHHAENHDEDHTC